MQVTYHLEKEDYLMLQLFAASQSKKIHKRRIVFAVLFALAFSLFSISAYLRHDYFNCILFIVVALVAAFLYPIIDRYRYKRHYAKHVEKEFKVRFGLECSLEITDTLIYSRMSDVVKSEINLKEIEHFWEIQRYMFIRLKIGGYVIIPLYQIDNRKELVDFLHATANQLQVEYTVISDWKYR